MIIMKQKQPIVCSGCLMTCRWYLIFSWFYSFACYMIISMIISIYFDWRGYVYLSYIYFKLFINVKRVLHLNLPLHLQLKCKRFPLAHGQYKSCIKKLIPEYAECHMLIWTVLYSGLARPVVVGYWGPKWYLFLGPKVPGSAPALSIILSLPTFSFNAFTAMPKCSLT